MRVAIVGGTQPRHMYYHNQIAQHYNVVGALLEHREGMLPQPPEWITPADRELWRRHFGNRNQVEARVFGAPRLNVPVKMVAAMDLNTPESMIYVMNLQPDLILVFGCHMLNWYLDVPMINLHLGLSPRYRGSATLFWPQYFLEPNWAGCTFHQIVEEPDAGQILHQCRPDFEYGDTIHEVSARAVLVATADMVSLLRNFDGWQYHAQRATGKNFLGRDFQPQHLRMIYDVYDDDIVDAYLNKEIQPGEPWLYQDNLYD